MAEGILVIDTFCSVIVFVIGIGLLYSKHTRYFSTKILMILLGVSLGAFFIDALGYVYAGREDKAQLLFWLYLIPKFMTYIIGTLCVWYLVEFIYERDERNVGHHRFLAIMAGMNFVAMLLVMDFVSSGRFFTVVDGMFVAGDLYRMSIYLNSITPIGMFLYLFMSRNVLKRHDIGVLMAVPIAPVIGYVLEIYHPDTSYSIAGITVGYLIMYILVMEKEVAAKLALESEKKELEETAYEEKRGRLHMEQAYKMLLEMQNEVEQERDRLNVVHKLVHSGSWEAKLEGREAVGITFSDEFRQLLGYTDEKDFPNEIGSWINSVYAPDRKNAERELLDSIKRAERIGEYEDEYRALKKDGSVHWYKGAGQIKVDAFGNGEAYGTFIDTTEFHELMEIQAVLKAMSEECSCVAAIDGVTNFERTFYFDEEKYGAYFDKWNEIRDFAERLKWLEKYIHQDDVERFKKETAKVHVRQMLRSGPVYYVKFRFVINGEEQYWKLKFSYANNDLNQIVVGFVNIDKETREELAYRNEVENERNRAKIASGEKSRFLYNMAHDVRTPMNAIFGYADIAERSIDNPERLKEAIAKMKSAGNILMDLVSKILEISRIEEGKIQVNVEECDIVEKSNQYISTLENLAADKKVVLIKELSLNRNRNVYMDTSIMNRIIVNVLSNAIKYSKEEGGIVKYRLEQRNSEKKGYSLYRFIISDNGVGMSEEFQTKLFEEFSREETEKTSGIEGNGLGLAIVYKLVKLLDGTIDVESKLDEGTTITINIPLKIAKKSSEKVPFFKKNKEECDYDGIRVLNVEDNAMNREILRDILEISNVEVEEATDGIMAIDMLNKSEPGHYDLIFMDVQMAPMDGYETTRRIRTIEDSRLANIPIVAVTANVFSEDISKAKEAGMDGYMSKPVSKEKVLDCIREYAIEGKIRK